MRQYKLLTSQFSLHNANAEALHAESSPKRLLLPILNLLQQPIPLPQPISCGSSSHGMPVFNTNTIPVRTTRFEIGGRPSFRRGALAGMTGSTIAHNSSLTNCFPIPHHQYHFSILPWFC